MVDYRRSGKRNIVVGKMEEFRRMYKKKNYIF